MSAHRVVFTPSGKRGEFADGTSLLAAARDARRRSRFGLRRAGHLRPLPGRYRRGRLRQARDSLERRSCDAHGARSRAATPKSAARLPPAGGSDARPRFAAISSSTCRPKARSTGRSCASAPRRIRSRSIPSCASITSRSPSRTCTTRRATFAACSRRCASNGASPRRTPISPRSRACRRRCARGGWKVTVALRKGRDIVALMPGFAERAYGVAIDVGSTTIAAHSDRSHERRGRRRGRGDEPANPLRRRPDEPRLLRDDEPGRRQGADAHGARGDGRADRRGRARGGRRARRDHGGDARRQSDHAPSRSRPRSDRARRGAVRADHRRRLRSARARARPRHRARRLRLRAALHRRPCRRGRGRRRARRGPASQGRADAARRRRHQRRDRVRQSRAAARLLLADRPGLRGRADLLRPARRAGRDRARAHRSRDARAAVQGDRLRPLVRRTRLRRGDGATRRHRRLRLRHHRGDRGNVPGRDRV